MIQPYLVTPSEDLCFGDANGDSSTPKRSTNALSSSEKRHRFQQNNSRRKRMLRSAHTPSDEENARSPTSTNLLPQSSGRYQIPRAGFSKYPIDAEERERIEKTAKTLFRRFCASDQYLKYRERQKDRRHGDEQKWPDRMELAFLEALVRWAPMGRGKFTYKHKLRGRNELIAEYIEEVTGEYRSRKQISSHIQVLKPLVAHDALIMKYLSNHNGRKSSKRSESGDRTSDTGSSQELSGVNEALGHINLDRTSQRGYSLDVLKLSEFHMFVQRNHDNTQAERLHTFTMAVNHPQHASRQLGDWPAFQRNYPLLAMMHAQYPLDGDVLHSHASLAFPSDTWRDPDGRTLQGVELGISFVCRSRRLPPQALLTCRNTFYKDGQCLNEHDDFNQSRMGPSSELGVTETCVKFGSSFWAKVLAYLTSRLSDLHRPIDDLREEVAVYLRSIEVMQEFSVFSKRGHERLLTVYWTFDLSNDMCGSTCWTNLKLPVPIAPSSHPDTDRVPAIQRAVVCPLDVQSSDPLLSPQAAHPPHAPPPMDLESCGSSALSSMTWATSLDDYTGPGSQQYLADGPRDPYGFEFMNPGLNLGGFDSAASSFGGGGGGGDDDNAVTFAIDPDLPMNLPAHPPSWYHCARPRQPERQSPLATPARRETLSPSSHDQRNRVYDRPPGHYFDRQAYDAVSTAHNAGGAAGIKDGSPMMDMAGWMYRAPRA